MRIRRPISIALLFGLISLTTARLPAEPVAADANLIPNGSLEAPAADGRSPLEFELTGDAIYGQLGDERERGGRGVRFLSGVDRSRDGERSGSLVTTVRELPRNAGRWFRLRIEGLAQEGFAVERDELFLDVEFLRDGGRNSLDHIKQRIYPNIFRDRADLKDAGTNRNLGDSTWRSYDLEFRTPFPEVDTLRISAGFARGVGKGSRAEFWIERIELKSIPVPADYQPPAGGKVRRGRDAIATLVPLGGRWYFDPAGGPRETPATFDHTNANRLFYLAEWLEAPFDDNTSAWLRQGYLDRAGNLVDRDRFVPDNVSLSFTPSHLVIHSHGLPNHPTATFPDRWRAIDGNPNYIREQDATWRIPLEPREDPNRVAMQNRTNNDHALPMGPIGVAVNGVVFFNPFDHLQDADAIWRLDRCCGHPAPNATYHYHKYPVCVKSPWSDDGAAHSPLIGFAFDGFPVYGPYEAAGELAKDSREKPLNAFNVHRDEVRGWHYHVTPGQFPHIIGGYWGQADTSNRRGPPPGGPPGGGPGRPPGFGPPPRRPMR